MKFLIKWAAGAAALYLTVYAGRALHLGLGLSGKGQALVIGAFVSVLVLTLVNTFIRPILVLLTLPLNCLTLGLFRFVVNALMFWLVGTLGLGLVVKDFVAALFGSVVLSVVSGILDVLIVERAEGKK